jgi:hypothetical protein
MFIPTDGSRFKIMDTREILAIEPKAALKKGAD